jgi:hypothetical protein
MAKSASRQVSPATVVGVIIGVLILVVAIYFLAFRSRVPSVEELPFKGQGPPMGKGPGMASPQSGQQSPGGTAPTG